MDTLEKIYSNSHSISDIENIPDEISNALVEIGKNSSKKKGLYTVLTTLMYYKYIHPEQDIRLHQERFEGGFSARGYDTQYITPVLKKLGLPAMAESGWLTRSLEQPYPYDFHYHGAIGTLKMPFLKTVDYIQNNPEKAYNALRILLHEAEKVAKANQVKMIPLENPESLTIEKIMNALEEHFLFPYGTHHGAKLPVLAFYAVYAQLLQELKRYHGCSLAPLSSLTACDKTNQASGDIEIFRNEKLFESVEIKLNKKITAQIIRVAESKIYAWNPERYYVLSVLGIEEKDKEEINAIVSKVSNEHGCQIIINGLLPTIKYYLRLIEHLDDFVRSYTHIVEIDTELQAVHKEKWNELMKKYFF